jgi:TPR repeat protein
VQGKKNAVYWYTKSAEQEFAAAELALRHCYKVGIGVAKDKKAKYWLLKAAKQRSLQAQAILDSLVQDDKMFNKKKRVIKGL